MKLACAELMGVRAQGQPSLTSRRERNKCWPARIAILLLILPSWISCLGCVSGLTTSSLAKANLLSSLNPLSAGSGELTAEQSAKACLTTAHELDRQDHLAEAIALYERARSMNPGLESVSRRLAVLYARTNQAAKARAEFDRAIMETPKDVSLRNDAAYFYLQSGDLANAEVQIQESLQMEAANAKAKMHLALLRAKQDRLDESFELFEQVVGPAEAHSNLGVILAKEGRSEEAIEHLDRARELDPKLPVPAAFLSRLRKNSQPSVH